MGRAKECELYKLTITLIKLIKNEKKERLRCIERTCPFLKKIIETMEPTHFLYMS
jgi:hypothetical protein